MEFEYKEPSIHKELYKRSRAEIVGEFSAVKKCKHNNYLQLMNCLNSSPQKYFSREVYEKVFDWLEAANQRKKYRMQKYFDEKSFDISQALFFLEEINNYDWHEEINKTSEYEIIRFIDQKLHPAYVRLMEGVLRPLLHFVALSSRLDRNAGVENLDIYNINEELKKTDLSFITSGYKDIIRNGISHGGITYLKQEISYRDKKGREAKFADRQFIRIFDDLLDVCNALAIAYKIFLLVHLEEYTVPRQLLLEELRALTQLPWWKIEGCVISKVPQGKQLLVYCQTNTYSYLKVLYSTFQSGILSEYFIPGYDRYFFAIESKKAHFSWAEFKGQKLKELRLSKYQPESKYKEVVEGICYVPKIKFPRVLLSIPTLLYSFEIYRKFFVNDFNKKLGRINILVKKAKIHRNSWGSVLNSSVIIKTYDGRRITQDSIRKFSKLIIRRTHKVAKEKTGLRLTRLLPIGYARIHLYQNDYRKRRIESFGLEADLIGTIQIKRIKRIESPDILNSKIEQHGKCRLAWNKKWLETFKE